MASEPPTLALPGFETRRFIGGGGMGEVFEAFHEELERVVAIKRVRRDRLDPSSPAHATAAARLRREAKLLAALNDPNIAAIYQVIEHEGVVHLIMEYVDGLSLRDVVRKGGPMPLEDAVEIARQVARGLHAAHEAGVIHRDIKPDNIRVNTRSIVKVLDFGLARELEDAGGPAALRRADGVYPTPPTAVATHPGAFVGTPGYASPEQCLGESVDQRTDVFSFGCVLFEMLAGRRPFDGDARQGPSIVLEGEADWALLPPGLPEEIVRLVHDCLAKARTNRPGDFAEVLGRLPPEDPSSTRVTTGSRRTPGTLAPVASNLPRALSPFIGRKAETGQVLRMVGESRCVTLRGLGGAGKTRLAIRVGECIVARERSVPAVEGVYLVRVEPHRKGKRLLGAVARAVGCREAAGRSLMDQLAAHFGAHPVVLILDACEHAMAEARALVEAVLERCPGVRVVCTSREPLSLAAETVYAMPTMSLPEFGDRGRGPGLGGAEAALAAASDAVALFLHRARQVWPLFECPPGQIGVVASICRRLGALPLAIEIAAGFVEAVGVEELDRELARGLEILERPLDSDPQARTLSSILNWSIGRLTPRDGLLLRRLAVFAGDFALAAAEAICGDDGEAAAPDECSVTPGARGGPPGSIRSTEVLGGLLALVRAGLVVRVQGGADSAAGAGPGRVKRDLAIGAAGPVGTRFRLLDPVKQHVLATARRGGAGGVGGELVAAMHGRHARYFLAFAERHSAQLDGPEQGPSMAALAADHHELLHALDASGDATAALRLAVAMARFWYKAGYPGEGRERLERAIRTYQEKHPGAPADQVFRRASAFVGVLRWAEGDSAGAQTCYRRALEMARTAGDSIQAAAISTNLGLALAEVMDMAGARDAHLEALQAAEQGGHEDAADWARLHIAMLDLFEGRLDEAQGALERCLERFRARGDKARVARALSKLGEVWYKRGGLAKALALHLEGLRIAHRIGHRPAMVVGIERCAVTAWRLGSLEEARRLLGLAAALRVQDGSRRSVLDSSEVEEAVAQVCGLADGPAESDPSWSSQILEGLITDLTRRVIDLGG